MISGLQQSSEQNKIKNLMNKITNKSYDLSLLSALIAKISLVSTVIITMTLAGQTANAAPVTVTTNVWNGAGANNNWNNGTNWASGVASNGGSTALQFSGTTRTNAVNNFGNNTTFAGITFGSDAGNFTLSGQKIILNGGITNNSANAQVISLSIMDGASGSDIYIAPKTASISITAPIIDSFNGAGKTIFISGSETVTLSATNTFTATTAITGGVGSLGNAGKLASTNIVVTNGATFLVSGAANGGLATGTAISLNGNISLNSTSGTRPTGVNAGNLTLTGTSSINFGAAATGVSEFSYYRISQNGNYLDIFNWKGSSTTPLFDNSLTGSSAYQTYSNILFYSGNDLNSTFLGMGQSFAGSNEIVPVPEPAVILSALLLLGTLIYTQRSLITRYLSRAMGLCYSVCFVWK